MMNGRDPDCIVIGGGVVGAACAYYLASDGASVRLLDAGAFGAACSRGNCGMVCPSHVLPLAAPGAIAKMARAMMRGDAALAVRLRWDSSLWRWMWNFARCCRHERMLETARVNHALLQSARRLYDELRQSPLFDCEWTDRGLLFVYNTEEEFDSYATLERLVRDEFGVPGKAIAGKDLETFEPALKPGLGGAWHYAGDAHLRPEKLMKSWRRLLEAAGVEIAESTQVDRLEVEHGAVSRIHTTRGPMQAGHYVLATGALAPKLGRDLGLRLAVQPGKGYSLTMPRPAIPPAMPLILESYHVGVTPFADGYRLGSTMEFAGYDETINAKRVALLTRGAEECLKTPVASPVLETWFGWRPMTYDGLPYVGRAGAVKNAFVVAGHGMLGISTSPATGKLAAELVLGRPPHLDPAPFGLERC
jgi:D-amino-acid dehydrogenase